MNEAKKRIMFVDDEPAILTALRSFLRNDRDRGDMVFAVDGEHALAEPRKQPYDIVSDTRMHGMEGVTALASIDCESIGPAGLTECVARWSAVVEDRDCDLWRRR